MESPALNDSIILRSQFVWRNTFFPAVFPAPLQSLPLVAWPSSSARRAAMLAGYEDFEWQGAFASDWRWPAGGVAGQTIKTM